MKRQIENKIEQIFEDLKRHQLATKFNIRSSDFDRLKENMLFLQLDSIEKHIKNIKLDLPSVDTGWFGHSKKHIKEAFFDFSDKYFNNLRERINEIFEEFNKLLLQKLGTDNEMKSFLKDKVIGPLKDSLSKIEKEAKENKNLKMELENELININKEIENIENKIVEVENQIKG